MLPNYFNFNVLESLVKTLPTVDVCILPYNLLLVPSARESCGIDLTNSVVIIDEAHNLAGAIESSYSNVLGLDSLDIYLSGIALVSSIFVETPFIFVNP